MATTKIIVLDDDPTGSQTVHGCLLLTRWDVATLKEALADRAPLFFILTNTRGMSAERASAVTREVCRNLKQALAGADIHPVFVSRSDSTLRGHYPVETDVMAEELGPFDRTFWCRRSSRAGASRVIPSITCAPAAKRFPCTKPNSRATRCSATGTATCRTMWKKNRWPH